MKLFTLQTARHNRRAGLTLVELMVSVAILSVIAVTFTTILSQSQRVVSTSQQTMRANATAAALAQTIQRDFRRITHNGFIRITGFQSDQRLYFVCAGPSRSVTGDTLGTGCIVGYGVCDNPNSDDDDSKVLYRTNWVLHRETGETPDFTLEDDVFQADLADIQRLGPIEMRDLIDDELESNRPDKIAVPPENLDEIEDLWMVLREGIDEVRFYYTNGEVNDDGELRWETGAKIWTRHNLDEWPVAFRVRFQLSEELLPPDSAPLTYEIVVPVRRCVEGLPEPQSTTPAPGGDDGGGAW